MQLIFCALVLIQLFFQSSAAYPQDSNSSFVTKALQGSNVLNPNVSVIGWFQGQAGRTPSSFDEEPAFRLREAEIGFQAAVDPYSRADIFVSVNDRGSLDVEEGYITALALPYGFQAKAGKFQPDIGKFNRIHTPETYFADRPLAALRFFGEEPLKAIGGGISRLIPNPWDIYVNVDAEAMNTPDSGGVAVFTQADREDLLYLGRISAFSDITESSNFNFGISYANGANGFEVNGIDGSSNTRRNDILVLDSTFRWKNPRRSIYRSFLWQTELYLVKNNCAPDPNQRRNGLFSVVNYQFARRWQAGARFDWAQRMNMEEGPDVGGLGYLTFTPSEFSLISLQGKHVKFSDGSAEDIGFLKMTFNIGPHGAHPF